MFQLLVFVPHSLCQIWIIGALMGVDIQKPTSYYTAHTAHAVRRHKTLLLNTCLFFDFDQTMGFYWSYMLLL